MSDPADTDLPPPIGNDDAVTVEPIYEHVPYQAWDEYKDLLYYAGIAIGVRGPKLIYRTSTDKFEEPMGPEAYARIMRLVPVPDSFEFGNDVTWDAVRDGVVELLKRKNVEISSVDFVRFTWFNKDEEGEIEEDEEDESHEEDGSDEADEEEVVNYDDIPFFPFNEYGGERYYTNPTIWIGVSPDSLNEEAAHGVSEEIRAFLDSLEVRDVDIAFRGSLYRPLAGHGPALFEPTEESNDPLKKFIDNVSVALSLPVAGCGGTVQGTLGPYFRVGGTLYAITARHNLFAPDEDNTTYRYHESAHKREVLLMSPSAFDNYLRSIQVSIYCAREAVEEYESSLSDTLRTDAPERSDNTELQDEVAYFEAELRRERSDLKTLEDFFLEIQTAWGNPEDRVIGFVRWAPPIGVGDAPQRYMRDLCVVQLYKDKFKKMVGNALNIVSPEWNEWTRPSTCLTTLINWRGARVVPSSRFRYPLFGLLRIKGIFETEQITKLIPSPQGDLFRRVIKHGSTTGTTVGTLTRFMSFVRQCSPHGPIEALQMPILNHEKTEDAFTEEGDSGSLVVSPEGEYVALLTAGTNKGTVGSDITYAMPFEWVWSLVEEEFPGADLDFENIEEFLADVA